MKTTSVCNKMLQSNTERGRHWIEFADKVLGHIESYTVPQYGDYPNDTVSKWSANMCLYTAEKYLNRRSSNQRPTELLLDLLKLVHFVQIAYTKETGGEKQADIEEKTEF